MGKIFFKIVGLKWSVLCFFMLMMMVISFGLIIFLCRVCVWFLFLVDCVGVIEVWVIFVCSVSIGCFFFYDFIYLDLVNFNFKKIVLLNFGYWNYGNWGLWGKFLGEKLGCRVNWIINVNCSGFLISVRWVFLVFYCGFFFVFFDGWVVFIWK